MRSESGTEYLHGRLYPWHSIALYCIVLHCIALYCTVLHCIVLYCIAMYYTRTQCYIAHSSLPILVAVGGLSLQTLCPVMEPVRTYAIVCNTRVPHHSGNSNRTVCQRYVHINQSTARTSNLMPHCHCNSTLSTMRWGTNPSLHRISIIILNQNKHYSSIIAPLSMPASAWMTVHGGTH